MLMHLKKSETPLFGEIKEKKVEGLWLFKSLSLEERNPSSSVQQNFLFF